MGLNGGGNKKNPSLYTERREVNINIYIMELLKFFRGGLVCCALAAFAACESEQEDLGNPSLTVSVTELAFDQVGGDEAVVLNATRDWRATSSAEWVVVTPASGEASAEDQTVVVSTLANDGGNRTADLTFTIGTVTKTVSVSQVGSGVTPDAGGDGTAASPYTAAKITEVANALSESDVLSDVYVAGTVSRIKTAYDAQYGNISYYIKNEGSDVEFLIYRGKYFNGDKFTSADQLKVGDEVVVCGNLKNFMGNTPEFDAGSKIISLNGQTSAGDDKPGPVTPTEKPEIPATVTSFTDFLAAEVGDAWYKLQGQIISIASPEYGNISIKDEAGNEIYVYGLTKDFSSTNDKSFASIEGLNVGDIITIVGQRGVYNDSPQAVNSFYISHEDGELEVVAGSYVLEFSDKANRTSLSTTQQVWEQNGVKVINDKASSTTNVADYAAPVRFYKSSKLTVSITGKTMTKIDFKCNTTAYAQALASSIPEAEAPTLSGSTVTVAFATPVAEYVVASLSGGQVRMDNITVYTE